MNQLNDLSTTKGSAIRLVNCEKRFGNQQVLLPTDLEVQAGETLVLLGPSGCGKSTTLRIIAGLESPEPGGQVFFGSEDVTAKPIEQRDVGMVFQSYALFPNMTVRENIEYGLKVRNMPAAARAERSARLMEMVEITALADRAITQLSGGQKQRVALARAVAPQPKVLLLDEPLTALDARLRDSLRTELNQLLRQLKTTAIYVTHDQTEAMVLADRIAVMDHGRICQLGTPEQIYMKPASRFVADFIGNNNRVQRDGHEWLLRPEDIEVVSLDTDAKNDHALITAAQFMGERQALTLSIQSGPLSGQQLEAFCRSRNCPSVGSMVGIRIDPQAWNTLPA
jgi:putative spermidine/putrescine transport system ATP-binding protein